MKKAKIIGLMAGVMTLVIAIGSTYAWFTSEADAKNVSVNAAKIEIASIDIGADPADLADVLPGEDITVKDLSLSNESTREAVVKIEITLDEDLSVDGQGVALRSELVDDIYATLAVDVEGKRADGGPATVNINNEKNICYIWLDEGENPDDFDFTFMVPEEMGGNVGYFELSENATPDQENEHLSEMYFTYSAVAVQGTEAAIADYFGQDVAEGFFPVAP